MVAGLIVVLSLVLAGCGGSANGQQNGGGEPVFLPDGSLVFRKGTRWYRAPRTTSGRPFGAPEPYWSDDALMNTSGLSNAVMPDGSLLYLQSVAPSTAGYVRVVRGWLKKATAAIR